MSLVEELMADLEDDEAAQVGFHPGRRHVDATGLRQSIVGPVLYIDQYGRLYNRLGEQVDTLGRLWRARGVPGFHRARGRHHPNRNPDNPNRDPSCWVPQSSGAKASGQPAAAERTCTASVQPAADRHARGQPAADHHARGQPTADHCARGQPAGW